jgi:hypothetical protein
MSKVPGHTIITREFVDGLDVSVRAANAILNTFEGCSVAELRAALADRRRPIINCGKVTTDEIIAALDGELHISPEAAERRVAQIKAEAEARIARLRTRAVRHLGVEWRP